MKEAPAASTESSATSKPSKVIHFRPLKYLQNLFPYSQRKKLSKQVIHSLPHSMILNFYAMFSVIYRVSTSIAMLFVLLSNKFNNNKRKTPMIMITIVQLKRKKTTNNNTNIVELINVLFNQGTL